MAGYQGASASVPQQFLNDVMFGTFLEKNKKEIVKGLANIYGVQQEVGGRENVANIQQKTAVDTTEMDVEARKQIAAENNAGELQREGLGNKSREAVAKIMADSGLDQTRLSSDATRYAAEQGRPDYEGQIRAAQTLGILPGMGKSEGGYGSYKPDGETSSGVTWTDKSATDSVAKPTASAAPQVSPFGDTNSYRESVAAKMAADDAARKAREEEKKKAGYPGSTFGRDWQIGGSIAFPGL